MKALKKKKQPLKRSIIKAIENLPEAPFPKKGIVPMLATLTDKPFDNESWIFEIKWDGYRAVTYKTNEQIVMMSRNLLPFNKYSIIKEELKKLKYNCILDGEVVAMDDNGVSSFQLLQNYMKRKVQVNLRYYLFDIIWLEGKDTTTLPLIERKELLRQIIPKSEIILFSEHYFKEGSKIYKTAQKLGLEGLMGKQMNSIYTPGMRTSEWLKIKTEMRQEAVICGFTEPRGSRKFFGALILGVYHNGKLKYAGHTGTGFDFDTLKTTYNLLQKYITDKSPFDVRVKTNQPVTWVKPKFVCEIKFSNWTSDDHMRHPVFMGIREDKSPKEVIRESA